MPVQRGYHFETPDHAALRRSARAFAEREIAPHASVWEDSEAFPVELYAKAGAAGLIGAAFEERLGGGGGDLSHTLVAAEELLFHGKSAGIVAALYTQTLPLGMLVAGGSPAHVERFVRPALLGAKIAALAITEPETGSDVAGIRTRALRDGDGYVINGRKTFITNGVRADFVCVLARTAESTEGGVSLFVVERGAPGFTVERQLRKMGWAPSDTAELVFEGCRVSAASLIGAEGAAFVGILQNFVPERLFLAGQAIAIAALAYEESIEHTRARAAFGKPLVGFQLTRHKLAEMATRIVSARALVSEVATRYVRGDADPALAAMAKNVATDACLHVVNEAVQLHGGLGFMRGVVVERLYRDARLYPIGGGTREIMNEIISRAELSGHEDSARAR